MQGKSPFRFFIVATLLASPAFGQSEDRIAPARWQQRFEEAKALPGALIQEVGDEVLLTVNTAVRQELYFFTAPTHSAHPAFIKINMQGRAAPLLSGAYAGSKDAYELWRRGISQRVSQRPLADESPSQR